MKVGTLLLKDVQGRVYRSALSIHAMMLDEFGLRSEDVVDSGIVVKGDREVWGIPNLSDQLKVNP